MSTNKENLTGMHFDLPKEQSHIIKVIGVGGGGSNAVNHMYRQGITGVNFVVCNTDAQALDMSPVPNKVQLGLNITEGLGAGSIPEMGRKAAEESVEEIKGFLSKNTKMVFITAGMGGGTGTGAAPIVAKVAKEMGILTVGIVTIPFSFEGPKRKKQANEGLEELRRYVDTLLIISNDKLRDMYEKMTLSEAFGKANDVLTTAAKGIAEIITVPGLVNVDFEDVRTVMKDGGSAIMGSATAVGENRAIEAVEAAMSSPLLDDNNIKGAKHVLLYITGGTKEIMMDEITEITDYVQQVAGSNADVIFGTGSDEKLGEGLSVTIIATGFKNDSQVLPSPSYTEKREVLSLNVDPEPKVEEIHKENEIQFEIKEAQVESKPEATPTPVFQLEINSKTQIEDEQTPILEEAQQVVSNDINEVIEFYQADKEESKPQIETKEKPIIEKISLLDDSDLTPLPQPEKNEVPERIIFQKEDKDPSYIDLTNPIKEKTQAVPQPLYEESERIRRIKALSQKIKSPSGLQDLENTPAIKGLNIRLNSEKKSSEPSQMSKYSISESADGIRFKSNNSYIHGNVD